MRFFDELKRRNVFRVAGLYLVVAWLATQVVANVGPMLGLPPVFGKGVLLLLGVGFPVALVLAWAFEVTPEGVKRTEAVAPGESITAKTGRTLDFVIIGGIALVGALIVGQHFIPGRAPARTADAGKVESVAVLPFVDMSPQQNEGYFSDGVTEEILNVLAHVPDLRVAGRTSSFSFKGKNEDIRKIGETLGVNHVLEGSIRKDGMKLRITAQLIRSSDGFHVWSETYDRNLTDIFAIQEDIAKSVADQLASSLGLIKAQDPDERPDVNDYESYLKGKDLFLKRGAKNLIAAQQLALEAVAHNPNYADAWALIASVNSVLPSYSNEGDLRRVYAAGEAAADRALAIDPANTTAIVTRGVFSFYDKDWISAFKSFDKATAAAPRDPNVLDTFAQQAIQVGYYKEAEAAARKATAIDPLNALYWNTLGWSLSVQGRYEEGIAAFEKGIAANPALSFPYFNEIRLFLAEKNAAGAAEVAHRAAKALAQTDDDASHLNRFADGLDQLAKGTITAEELRKHPDFTANGSVMFAMYLKDPAERHRVMKSVLLQPFERLLYLFGLSRRLGAEMFDDPDWRQKVKELGLPALWRERGLPDFCHAVGDDDFACAAPEQKGS